MVDQNETDSYLVAECQPALSVQRHQTSCFEYVFYKIDDKRSLFSFPPLHSHCYRTGDSQQKGMRS